MAKKKPVGAARGKKKPAAAAAKKGIRKVAETPEQLLRQANALVREGVESGDCEQEIGCAVAALQLSTDCTEAYLVLAEHTGSDSEAVPFFERAREVARQALGDDFPGKREGQFWADDLGRNYLRATMGVGECYWTLGAREAALGFWEEILQLDQADHMGARQLLIFHLLEEQQADRVLELLQQYPEKNAMQAFALALAQFQQQGDSPTARKTLQRGCGLNPLVATYLLKEEFPPEAPLDEFAPGSPDEAAHIAAQASAGWWQSPGAITWLRSMVSISGESAIPAPAANGPHDEVKLRLRQVPQQYGLVFQGAIHQFPKWIQEGANSVRPWAILLMNANDQLIVAQEVVSSLPTAAVVWDRLVQGIEAPFAGAPHRPSEIQVAPHPLWEELKPHLQEVGIDVIYRPALDQISGILAQFQEFFDKGQPERGLSDIPHASLEMVRDFYAAAAEFYRSKPWRRCADDRAINIRFSGTPSGKKGKSKRRARQQFSAVIMGQGGLTYGLAIYDEPWMLEALWDSGGDPSVQLEECSVCSVMYGENLEMSAADLQAVEANGWDIATPEAYPTVVRAEPEQDFRSPTALELEQITAMLRAIPEFAEQYYSEREATASYELTVAGQPHSLQLSWYNPPPLEGHDHDHDAAGHCLTDGDA